MQRSSTLSHNLLLLLDRELRNNDDREIKTKKDFLFFVFLLNIRTRLEVEGQSGIGRRRRRRRAWNHFFSLLLLLNNGAMLTTDDDDDYNDDDGLCVNTIPYPFFSFSARFKAPFGLSVAIIGSCVWAALFYFPGLFSFLRLRGPVPIPLYLHIILVVWTAYLCMFEGCYQVQTI